MVSTRGQSNGNPNGNDHVASSNDIVSKMPVCVTRSIPKTNNVKDTASNKIALAFMDLPFDAIEEIVKRCSYNTIANLRVVNKTMNNVCGHVLTATFTKIQKDMFERLNDIKSQMPRRESARRSHPLTCEFDIIETIYMRLSLLHMTFGKHIERRLICFFPGEVLDEVNRIRHLIKVSPKLPRPYKVTEELVDLTTMAMEYFKEKLESTLPDICGSSSKGSKSLIQLNNNKKLEVIDSVLEDEPQKFDMVLRKRIQNIKKGMRLYSNQLTTMKREMKTYKSKMTEQQKTTINYSLRLKEYEKKNEDMSRKYSTVFQELNKCKTEFQYWRSKSPMNPVCGSCGTPVASLPEDLESPSNQDIEIPTVVVHHPVSPSAAVGESFQNCVVEKVKPLVDKDVKTEFNISGIATTTSVYKDRDFALRDVEEKTGSNIETKSLNETASCSTSLSSNSNSEIDNPKERAIRTVKRKAEDTRLNQIKKLRGTKKLRNKTIRL